MKHIINIFLFFIFFSLTNLLSPNVFADEGGGGGEGECIDISGTYIVGDGRHICTDYAAPKYWCNNSSVHIPTTNSKYRSLYNKTSDYANIIEIVFYERAVIKIRQEGCKKLYLDIHWWRPDYDKKKNYDKWKKKEGRQTFELVAGKQHYKNPDEYSKGNGVNHKYVVKFEKEKITFFLKRISGTNWGSPAKNWITLKKDDKGNLVIDHKERAFIQGLPLIIYTWRVGGHQCVLEKATQEKIKKAEDEYLEDRLSSCKKDSDPINIYWGNTFSPGISIHPGGSNGAVLRGGFNLEFAVKKAGELGVYGDASWDFGSDNFRFSSGMEYELFIFGLQFGYLGQIKDDQYNNGIRTSAMIGMSSLSLVGRWGHFFGEVKEADFFEIGLSYELWIPIW